MFKSTQATTLHCADCGKRGTAHQILAYPGAVSAPSDEGHVRRTAVLLCGGCATARLELQEPAMGAF
jgi:hypothetical protein